MRLLFIFILVLAAVTDARTRKIPDLFPALIVVLALCRFVKTPSMLLSGAVGLFAVSLPMLLLALLKGGLGGGDIKLCGACGMFLGVDALLFGTFLAALFALLTFLVRPLPERFAFGPFLAAGFILAVVAG